MLKVHKYEGFSALPLSYEPVFTHGGKQSFFLTLPWFRNFERTVLNPGAKALIYGIEETTPQSRPLAALVVRQNSGTGGMAAPTTVEGLGNYYTSYFSPVFGSNCGDRNAVVNAFAEALWSDRHLWDVCNLQPLDPDLLTFSSLENAFRHVGMVVQTYFCFGNWYLEVNGRSYNEYIETLPSVLKETVRRKGKKLEKQDGVRIEIITDVEGALAAVENYTKIYNSSWKNPEPYSLFMPGLIHTCAEMGWLRLGLVYVDNEPVATQLWIVNEDVASIYKLAYDERFAKLSVGTVLTARLMQYVIDIDKVAVVDYLTGDDVYKKDWMSHRRERWGIMAFNPQRPKGLIQAVRHVGGRAVKRTVLRMTQPLLKMGSRTL